MQTTTTAGPELAGEPPRPSLTQRLMKGSLFVVGGRMLGIVVGLCINLYLAQALSKDDFGRYSLLVTSSIIFSTAARFGLDRLLLRYVAELESTGRKDLIESLLSSSMRLAFLTTVVFAAVMFFALFSFSAIRNAAHPSLVVGLTLGVMASMTLLQLVAESFRGLHDLKRATFFDPMRTGPLVGLLFGMLLTGLWWSSSTQLWNVLLVFFVAEAVLLVLAGIQLWRAVRRLPAPTSAEADRAAVEAGLPSLGVVPLAVSASSLAMVEVLAVLIGFGDVWIAGALLPEAELASWSVTTQLMQLVGVPLSMINLTIISSIPPLVRQGKLQELQSLLQGSASVATLFSLLPLTLLIVFPGPIISMIFGAKYLDAAVPLAIASLGKLVFVWTGTCGYTLMLTGNQRIVLVNNIFSSVLLFTVGYFGTLNYGLTGLAVTACAVTIFSNLFNWLAARHTVGVWTHGTLSVRPIRRFLTRRQSPGVNSP